MYRSLSSFPEKKKHKSMTVNLIRTKWNAVSNLACQRPNLCEEIMERLRKTVGVYRFHAQKEETKIITALASPLMR